MRTAAAMLVLILVATAVAAETTITINGRTISSSEDSITVNNGTVIVGGNFLSGRGVEGSGKTGTEDREFGHFNDVHLNISADVRITEGTEHRCRITADDNILPLILTERFDNTLRIFAKESYSSTRSVVIAIETPLLTGATISGSGRIDIAEVTKDKLGLVINGSGDITAKGEVVELNATINGSGDLRAAGLEAETAAIIVNGSGNADVLVTDALTARVGGSGDITYAGSPATVQAAVTGSGNIAQR